MSRLNLKNRLELYRMESCLRDFHPAEDGEYLDNNEYSFVGIIIATFKTQIVIQFT